MRLFHILADDGRVETGVEADAIFAAVETAGLYEASAAEAIERDDGDGAEREAFAQTVRFVGDDAGYDEAGRAIAEAIAGADGKPVGQSVAN
jgi:hypothetical protein